MMPGNITFEPTQNFCLYNNIYCKVQSEIPAYTYLANQDYIGFILHYGIPFIIFTWTGSYFFHLIGEFFEWYYTEKRQKERMKMLPGVYKK